MTLSPDAIIMHMQGLVRGATHAPSAWVLAFSGGLDSTVLLHLLATQREKLGDVSLNAIHVNHGLQSDAAAWASHCATMCAMLAVPFESVNVHAKALRGESPEDAARNARYAALTKMLPSNACLMLAQHQDDQAETLLLQLLRGAGVRGLAAMPRLAPFGAGIVVRPLLDVTRVELEAYAREHKLQWVEDPSNADTRFDRNFLRQTILPALKQRWGSASQTLARSADNCAEAAQIIAQMGEQDLQQIKHGEQNALSIRALKMLSPERQKNVLFYWFEQQGAAFPSRAQLEHVLRDVVGSKLDATPLVRWSNVAVRRYRDALLLQREESMSSAAGFSAMWDLRAPLEIPGVGVLVVDHAEGDGLSVARLAGKSVEVRLRRGGERCKPAGDRLTRSLKKLLQTAQMPPWVRLQTPLVFVEGVLSAVPGCCYCEPFAAKAGEPSLRIRLLSETES